MKCYYQCYLVRHPFDMFQETTTRPGLFDSMPLWQLVITKFQLFCIHYVLHETEEIKEAIVHPSKSRASFILRCERYKKSGTRSPQDFGLSAGSKRAQSTNKIVSFLGEDYMLIYRAPYVEPTTVTLLNFFACNSLFHGIAVTVSVYATRGQKIKSNFYPLCFEWNSKSQPLCLLKDVFTTKPQEGVKSGHKK